MKPLLLAVLTICGACFTAAQAQNIEGQIIASQYGQWKVQGYAPDTYTFAPTACEVQGGRSFFPAFSVGTPVLIVDGNPALDEVVTPSSVVNNDVTCAISITPAYHHNVPFYLTSATGGLQEAINANSAAPGPNTILLNNAWYRMGGSPAMIAGAQGKTQLGLIDITTLPSTWYRWNGSAYVPVPFVSSISSVFGRTGAVVAETGDYTCAQVTGCPTLVVNSFAGRSGAVTTETGDYNCLQVINCAGGPVSAWGGLLAANEGPTDTSASITLESGTLPADGGYFYIGTEWEYFSGYTLVSGSTYTLNGLLRGQFTSTAASHSSGSGITNMIQDLTGTGQAPFAWVGGYGSSGQFFSIDCPFGNSINDTIVFEIGCGDFTVSSNGGFGTTSSGTVNGSLTVGTAPGNTYATTADYVFRIQHTSQVLQTTVPQQVAASIGYAAGIPDAVVAVQPPNATAPGLVNFFIPSGSTTNTYVCQGTDAFGNNIPGTPASITGLASSGWTTGEYVGIFCPPIPGAASVSIYRTAGVPNTGLLGTFPGSSYVYADNYTTATTGSPTSTNTTIPLTCVNGTAGAPEYCILAGTSSMPPLSCTASQEGWEYHDTAATPLSSVQRCLSGSWVPLQTSGIATLSSGTVTVSTAAACTVGANCKYQLTHCALNSSTAVGTLAIGSITAQTSFVINSESATATVATGDVSTVCWRIN